MVWGYKLGEEIVRSAASCAALVTDAARNTSGLGG